MQVLKNQIRKLTSASLKTRIGQWVIGELLWATRARSKYGRRKVVVKAHSLEFRLHNWSYDHADRATRDAFFDRSLGVNKKLPALN